MIALFDGYELKVDSATLHEWIGAFDAAQDRREGVFGPQIGDRLPLTGDPVAWTAPDLVEAHAVLWEADIAIWWFEPSTLLKGDRYNVTLPCDQV